MIYVVAFEEHSPSGSVDELHLAPVQLLRSSQRKARKVTPCALWEDVSAQRVHGPGGWFELEPATNKKKKSGGATYFDGNPGQALIHFAG